MPVADLGDEEFDKAGRGLGCWREQPVRMSPFGRRCKFKEEPLIAAELSEVIADEISKPQIFSPTLLSFGGSSIDFKNRAPTAAKYCDWLEGYSPGSGGLHLPPNGSFSPADAEAALRVVITKKLQKKSYTALRKELGLRSLYLLIYYDAAIVKNTPNMDVDPRAVATAAVAGIESAFDAVLVLMFPGGDARMGRQVFRV